jgi:hypothetical protein
MRKCDYILHSPCLFNILIFFLTFALLVLMHWVNIAKKESMAKLESSLLGPFFQEATKQTNRVSEPGQLAGLLSTFPNKGRVYGRKAWQKRVVANI